MFIGIFFQLFWLLHANIESEKARVALILKNLSIALNTYSEISIQECIENQLNFILFNFTSRSILMIGKQFKLKVKLDKNNEKKMKSTKKACAQRSYCEVVTFPNVCTK